MGRKRTSVASGVIWAVWSIGAACASVPMRSPVAVLEEKRWAASIEYGYGEMDLRAYGLNTTTMTGEDPSSTFEVFDVEGLRSHTLLAGLAYGVCDNWDLFVRLGVADTQDDIVLGPGERFAYGGGSGLAWGLGTRGTFCQWGPWSFGGLTQVTWLEPGRDEFSLADPGTPGRVSVGFVDASLWQAQVSLAAAYQIDTLHFWAGPFLEFVEGDLDRSGRILIDGIDSGTFHGHSSLEERTQFGAQFGAMWEMSDAVSFWTSGQVAGDSWSIGFGSLIQPQRLFDHK